MKKVILGISGASGSLIGKKLIQHLCAMDVDIHLLISHGAENIFKKETGIDVHAFIQTHDRIFLHDVDVMDSPLASGSHHFDAMIIAPCSMGTLGRITAGTSDNLMIRAADVCLKENVPLVLVPRETPMNLIHLENLLTIKKAGAHIYMPVPAFYAGSKDLEDLVDQMCGRILKLAGFPNAIYRGYEV